ncbi:MAG: oligosaccharide flippase family protein [Ignavibacterium album]|uniref:oligosaccharide flippase family protein n=1 Tax=Ignavibacterium album TaxID=591197 RepID=UPI0026EB4CD1|nr:oligosaccharide flippase family protein [Ignavibacterium album]MBI5663326.1 oligosaccharide flippase family protein [Ignavibacterium album]
MIKNFLTQYKHLIKEGSWVFFGQISVAIIGLIGLRILTEIAPANILGGATLLLGTLTLLKNIFISPIGNTQIRFHPEYVNEGHAKWFNENIKKLYLKFLVLSILVFIIIFTVWVYLSAYTFNILLLLILILYYFLDAVKGFKINRLSAERRQKYAAIWQTADALFVNLFFIVALMIINNVESYLAGQAIGLFIGLLIFGFITYPQIGNKNQQNPDDEEIKSKVIKYGLPFIPLAIVSWISNLGDRYIISNYLSLNEVGIYTAVYSIASRPFLMVGGILSGFFRPLLFHKEGNKDFLKAKKIFKLWLFSGLLIFGCGLIIYLFLGNFIIKLLLSRNYAKNVFNIFLLIGLAYAIFCINQIIENRLYSFGLSKKVIFPSVFAAIFNLVANIILIPLLGLEGAALATLGSFSFQLLIISLTLYVI